MNNSMTAQQTRNIRLSDAGILIDWFGDGDDARTRADDRQQLDTIQKFFNPSARRLAVSCGRKAGRENPHLSR